MFFFFFLQSITAKSYFNGPLNQWTLKESESVYETCQHSSLPHHCRGHWFQLSINNSGRSLFSCLQLQGPLPLCCPHTLLGSKQPLAPKHQGDSSMWHNTAKHFWQSFCHLANHVCVWEINTWHLSHRRRVLFPTEPVGNAKQWGDFLINEAAGGVQIAAGVRRQHVSQL